MKPVLAASTVRAKASAGQPSLSEATNPPAGGLTDLRPCPIRVTIAGAPLEILMCRTLLVFLAALLFLPCTRTHDPDGTTTADH